MKTAIRLLWVLSFAAASQGCVTAFSPQGRVLPLETVATLAPGKRGIQVEGAKQVDFYGESYASGTLRARWGLRAGTDLSVEGSLLHYDEQNTPLFHSDPNVGSLRLGLKQRLGEYVAVTGGVGGGSSAGGLFASPDVGVILSVENPSIVPFASVRFSVSQPLTTAPVYVPTETVSTDGTGFFEGKTVQTAYLKRTWSAAATIGVRVPIGRRVSLLVGLGYADFFDGTDSVSTLGVAGGVEATF